MKWKRRFLVNWNKSKKISRESISVGTSANCLRELEELKQELPKREIPTIWNNAIIILLYKKGDKVRVENFRLMSLLSVLYKMFTKIILNCIERDLDSNQGMEPAEFRRGLSTMDHIQTLNEVMERTNEYELPLCLDS